MQFKFLFLVALTPKTLINPLRQRLQDLSLSSLNLQEYDNYAAIILGEEEKIDGNLIFVKAPDGTKGERLKFAMGYIQSQNINYEYLCRFDDDDVLNPHILDLYKNATAACIADKYHAFFDLYSKRSIQTKRNWMANTVFLRKDFATYQMKNGLTLIEQDHAQEWLGFFKGTDVQFASKKHPIYLRVLSPTSETANIDISNYQNYLKSFGDWKKAKKILDFEPIIKELNIIGYDFFENEGMTFQSDVGSNSLVKRFKNKFFN